MGLYRFQWIFWVCIFGISWTLAQTRDLTELSLEELMNIEVTLSSRKAEKIGESASAVLVLTHEDIKNSGVTSIPEALRLLPGFHVARVDANKWAISARGFSTIFANKLQVLMDGRSVYSPIFSGVFWESQDMILDDIDRIEVIRGPGASLWGANAVNGIINVISKSSQETQGFSIGLGKGAEEKSQLWIRYGSHIGEKTHYRVFFKYFDRDNLVFSDREKAKDGWWMWRGGFRIDGKTSSVSHWTFQGELFQGCVGQTLILPFDPFRLNYTLPVRGGYLLACYQKQLSRRSEVKIQASLDRYEREDSILVGGYYQNTDIDFQHRIQFHPRYEMSWGVGYRVTHDRVHNTSVVYFVPASRTYDVMSAFIHNEFMLCPNHLRLILGSKFEFNDFTGFEYQPNLRMHLKFWKEHVLWASLARAVRTPSRADLDLRTIGIIGNRKFQSEILWAHELGYRYPFNSRLFLDFSGYANQYDKIQSFEPDTIRNYRNAKTYGLEATAVWHPKRFWTARLGYTFCRIYASADAQSVDTREKDIEKETPRHQYYIWNTLDLFGKMECDVFFRWVGGLSSPSVYAPSYPALDIRWAWHVFPTLEFSIVGQNLNAAHHPEFSLVGQAGTGKQSQESRGWWFPFQATESERGVYFLLRWRW